VSVLGGPKKLASVALVCALSLLAESTGVFSGWNRAVADARMSVSPIEASADVVIVAIDSQSLNDIGVWPWSRSVHAEILTYLVDAGAADILLDFDFTFPSDGAGDVALADALDRAGGSVMLPVFAQRATDQPGAPLDVNVPLQAFADRSWPALVNVGVDADGLVRDYPMVATVRDDIVTSAGALLAGQLGSGDATIEINYALRPETIPVYSAIDVMNGSVGTAAFTGRSVVVGATAVELSDQLAVPVHGVLPGPFIHVLAAETLSGDRSLRWLRAEAMVPVLLVLLVFLQNAFGRAPWISLATTGLGLAIVEALALAAFRETSLLVPTVMLYPALIGFSLWRLTQALTTSTWLLRRSDASARNTRKLLERVFDDSSDAIIVISEDGNILRYSRSALEIFGCDAEWLPDFAQFLNRSTPTGSSQTRKFELNNNGAKQYLEYRVTQSDLEVPIRTGSSITRTVTTLIIRDVTRLQEQQADIAYLSNFDERTGAMRRTPFLSFLRLRLKEGRNTLLFVMSLPQFKTINVTLGREIGDALLKDVVRRLEACPVPLSTVARLGGTTFAFYAEVELDASEAEATAQRIRKDIARPYRLANANAQVDVRLGYTSLPKERPIPAETALERAEEALDSAKARGTSIAAFDPTGWDKQRRAREIERAMEGALENDEFRLVYQPQHRVADGRLIGAEALMRWDSPALGQVFPGEFIEIAESSGFIVDLGRWVLEKTARDASTLPDDLTIAVNVSGNQLTQGDFVGQVNEVLERVGAPGSRLCLELTESVLLASTDEILQTMRDLCFKGLTWALDDFGTGYSSMAYLSQMPLEKVKLDKSFTMGLGKNTSARPILHSTAELCRGLGVKLLCEGVETAEHLAVLREECCDEAQGYYFGKPLDLSEFASLNERLRAQS